MSQNESIWSDNIRTEKHYKYNTMTRQSLSLTYQDSRTGCITPWKYIERDWIQSTHSLAHCVWRDFAMEKGIVGEVIEKFPLLQSSALEIFFDPGTIVAYWHEESQRFIHNLVTKVKCSAKPIPSDVANAIEALREYMLRNNAKVIARPEWQTVLMNYCGINYKHCF